jgi:hypothetical protein
MMMMMMKVYFWPIFKIGSSMRGADGKVICRIYDCLEEKSLKSKQPEQLPFPISPLIHHVKNRHINFLSPVWNTNQPITKMMH